MEITYKLSELDQVAEKLLAEAQYKTIVFIGDLGAGKTTLIKALVKQLGSNDHVSSPTFSILNEYRTDAGTVIYHMDLYRLKSQIEAFDMGLEEILESSSWKFIEWPDKINNLLDMDYHSATIVSIKEGSRTLKLN